VFSKNLSVGIRISFTTEVTRQTDVINPRKWYGENYAVKPAANYLTLVGRCGNGNTSGNVNVGDTYPQGYLTTWVDVFTQITGQKEVSTNDETIQAH
jgi:hypothetical protein